LLSTLCSSAAGSAKTKNSNLKRHHKVQVVNQCRHQSTGGESMHTSKYRCRHQSTGGVSMHTSSTGGESMHTSSTGGESMHTPKYRWCINANTKVQVVYQYTPQVQVVNQCRHQSTGGVSMHTAKYRWCINADGNMPNCSRPPFAQYLCVATGDAVLTRTIS
jgi:hypothetical protein